MARARAVYSQSVDVDICAATVRVDIDVFPFLLYGLTQK
jgi:hypothetical protein